MSGSVTSTHVRAVGAINGPCGRHVHVVWQPLPPHNEIMTGSGPTPHNADAAMSPARREAAALDRAGRHSDALAVLSRAATAGDQIARRTVGLRILLGDRAPPMGPSGVRLIAEAATQGDAAAADISAVIAGAGIHCTQDWNRALDWLQLAAELGSSRARGALGVLCADPDLAARAAVDAAPAVLWRQLRADVDLAAWLTVPPGRTLHADPLIRAHDKFTDSRTRTWLIARARDRLSPALVYNPGTQELEQTPERSNTSAGFSILDVDLSQILLQARIAATVGAPFSHLESPFVLHYVPGQVFEDHYDFVDPETPNYEEEIARNGQRMVTFLVYLNDDYEGGQTEFPRLKLSYSGKAGDGFYFVNALPDGTADTRTLHAGRTPLTGEKWIFSQFIRNRPVVPGTRADTTFTPRAFT
jgi:prolyl 4-hydroxylase